MLFNVAIDSPKFALNEKENSVITSDAISVVVTIYFIGTQSVRKAILGLNLFAAKYYTSLFKFIRPLDNLL